MAGVAACALGTPAAAQDADAKSGDKPPPVAAPVGSARVFTPADFARFAPRTALDMLSQVPGFTIRGEDGGSRGLGQASGNVLLNGERISGKSTDPVTALQAIPAGNVKRIEILDAAEVDVPGLTGQVANVVYEASARLSGQFSYRPEIRAHYADPLLTRGDVSVSGAAGPVDYTLSLQNNGSRGAAGGPTLIRDGLGEVIERRDDRFTSNYDQPQLSGQFKIDGPGSSLGNLNLLYRRVYYRFDEDSRRDRLVGPDQRRRLATREDGYNYEIGGDYEFALGGGRLKLIGVNRLDTDPFTSTSRTLFADDGPDAGSRFVQDSTTKELIGRAEYRWKTGRSDWQVSGEAAFNSLDNVSGLFLLDGAGDFVPVPFPGGTGRVGEDRYEALVTWARPLSPILSAQVVAGGEYSTLSQEGEGGKTRSFFRPKGSVSLSAQFNPTLSANLKAIRRVGQLDFDQFLAEVFLDNENENAGNPDLVPTQQWRFELEVAKNLGALGQTKVNLVAAFFEDFIDIVPIGATGESPGNIPSARAFAIDWASTFQLDPLGLKGARVDVRAILQTSSIRDPLTGETRQLSGFQDRLLDLDFRHDIPDTDWAYGLGAFSSHITRSFRLNEIVRGWEGPIFANLFVENKDVLGLTVRATAGNVLDARSRLERVVFAGRRNAAPVAFSERRDRLIGPIFSLSVRGTF